MKILLTMACLIFVGLSFQANAAKKDWQTLKQSESLDLKGESKDYADVYSFYVPVRIGQINQTQTFVVTIDEIRDFASLLAGADGNKGKGNRVDRIVGLLVANLSSTFTNNMAVSSEGSPLAVNPTRDQAEDINPPVQGTTPDVFRPATPDDTQPIRVVETPIPAAIWLFGTALLGLIGIRFQARG